MKIAILANGIDHDASAQRCFVALLEHGHVLTFVDGNAVAAVQQMVEDGVDAILKRAMAMKYMTRSRRASLEKQVARSGAG